MNYEVERKYWKKLVERYSSKGYEILTIDERIWFNVRCLIDAVDNGGLISFYYNYGADYLLQTMEDLEMLRATDVIKLLDKINILFPGGMPSRNHDERNEVINSWEDGQFDDLLEELDDKFYSLEEQLEADLEPIITKVISLLES